MYEYHNCVYQSIVVYKSQMCNKFPLYLDFKNTNIIQFKYIPQVFLHTFSLFFVDHHPFPKSFYAVELSLYGDFLSIQIPLPGLYLFKNI